MAHYKRKIYLINPKFQIRFSLLVCLLIFISSIFYPIAIYNLIDSIITYLGANFPHQAGSMIKTFEQKQKILILILALWQIGFIAIIFIACIFFSHKIAGPVYKTNQFFRQIQDGDNPGKLFFRHGDYFPELAEEFNKTFEAVYEKHQNDFAYLSEVSAYLNNLSIIVPDDKKVVLNEINKKLNEIQARFDSA